MCIQKKIEFYLNKFSSCILKKINLYEKHIPNLYEKCTPCTEEKQKDIVKCKNKIKPKPEKTR